MKNEFSLAWKETLALSYPYWTIEGITSNRSKTGQLPTKGNTPHREGNVYHVGSLQVVNRNLTQSRNPTTHAEALDSSNRNKEAEKMTDCKRKGKFDREERHKCFVKGCDAFCYPALSKTCSICNWKRCESGHCGCSLTEEARYAVDILYSTFCEFCSELE